MTELRVADLRVKISEIGRDMVSCRKYCDGVDLDPPAGKLPRGLDLEIDGRDGEQSAWVIGLNPGRARSHEMEYLANSSQSFEDLEAYWNLRGREHPYHDRIKRLVDAWGITGPILWSNLAKCQTKQGVDELPLQTFRTCVTSYLVSEANVVPKDWLILAAGQEAYKAVSYLFRDRRIIGVPHPTGSRLTTDARKNLKQWAAKSIVQEVMKAHLPSTRWLPDALKKAR